MRYFPLREGAIDSATRAVIWSGESAKDLVIFQLNFTAVGVDTLMSDVLWVRPGGDFTAQESHQFGRCPFVCNVRGAASDYVGTALRCHSLRRLR